MREDFRAFWSYCASIGVVSRPLHLRCDGPFVSVHASAPLRAGAVVLSVPYLSVWNAQTLTGDMRPPGLPPPRALCAFLTRRRRMSPPAARALWLVACVALWAKRLPPNAWPLLSAAPKPHASGGRSAPPAEKSLRVLRAAIRFYRRRAISPAARRSAVSMADLRAAGGAVSPRALFLPAGGAPSAPETVSALLDRSPRLVALPSLVPVVDLIAEGTGEAANCALHTCTQADFLAPNTRRRVVVETAPFANRRVVVCATRDIKEGEELCMQCDS